MKEQIWLYLKKHPESTHHQIASALNISELECCKALLTMQKEQIVRLHVYALQSGQDPECSDYYSAVGSEFPQKYKEA